MRVSPAVLLGLAVALSFPASEAIAAPVQLNNRTIIISWSEQVSQIGPDGITNPTVNSEAVAYVSSAGRLFVRGKRSIDNRKVSISKQREFGPGAGSSRGAINFQGNQLVGTAVYNGFARRLVVSFDAGFTSCTASVAYGKTGGPRTWKGLDGQVREMLSVSVSGANCSIREGNALAS